MDDIPDHPNYKINKLGDVWSNKTKRFVYSYNSDGYRQVSITSVTGRSRCLGIHRLMAYAYLGLDLDDRTKSVDHINNIKDDNRLENLRVLSILDHNRDKNGRLGVDTDTHKLCKKCGVLRPREEFNKRRSVEDGLRSLCKVCAKQNNRRYYENFLQVTRK